METLKMPRVLFLLPFAPPGALALSIAREFRQRGLNCAVMICRDSHPDYDLDSLDDFHNIGAKFTIEDHERGNVTAAIFRVIDTFQPNVILQIGASELYRALSRVKERYKQVTLIDCLYNHIGHTVNHFLFENVFDGVIVESVAMKALIGSQSIKSEPNISVISSGVANTKYLEPQGVRSIKPGRAITVGYFGRLSPEKNPLGFAEISEIFFPLGVGADVHFVIYGQGPQSEAVRERCNTSIGATLTFSGFASDQFETMRSFDLLVVPSITDGRPLSIMEANAVGVPVIASSVGGIPEMIVEGVNGFTFPNGDYRQAADIISSLCRDPVLLNSLQRSSYVFAVSNFSYDTMIDAYIHAISDCISLVWSNEIADNT